MFFPLLAATLTLLSRFLPVLADANLPVDKIYGVNIGGWLLIEPWMLPQEWQTMGGEVCSDCSSCIGSELLPASHNIVSSALSQKLGSDADSVFDAHWSSWFTQDDINTLKGLGINTVRIPLGYWLVEQLVDRDNEFYPKGGIKQLKRGLQQLQAAGIFAILDHHALPGVQTPNQAFAGRCTTDVEFYTSANYHRALVWTAVMTAITHLDPDFGSVFAIQAVNEPIMDASQTPGYGDFQANFVQVVRAVESLLTIPSSGGSSALNLNVNVTLNATDALLSGDLSVLGSNQNSDVSSALQEAAGYLPQILVELGVSPSLSGGPPNIAPLITNFMDISWQFNNPPNPSDAQNGPQAYDNHLYYSFGGVADATPDAYLASICSLNRVQTDAGLGNTPLWFGEWALSTQFNATDDFLVQWADAQKSAYSQGSGWIFWNFKVEESDAAGDLARQWSYIEGVKRGYFTQDPSQLNNPNVCGGTAAPS